MPIRDLIPETLANLQRNRSRSLATMLSVMIGIFAVLLILGTGAGIRAAIEQDLLANHVSSELLGASTSVSGVVKLLLLTCLAALSLFVGTTGMMDIMMAAVAERKREIGIRRAVGARRSAIFVQFLFETLIVIFAGALASIFLALVGSSTIGGLFHYSIHLPLQGIAAALSVSAFMGIASGLYPARRASQVDVVEALHLE